MAAKKGKKKWMQTAVKHPGAFTAWAKKQGLSMSEAIAKGKKSKNPTIRKRANLAATFRKVARKRKKK